MQSNSDINTSIVMISWCPNAYRLKRMKLSFESLKANTRRPHLLIVIDNGLEEQTDYFRLQDIDVYYKPDVNIGVGASRNKGASLVETDYIAFVDNDILYFPNWLNECVKVLEKYPDRKLISTPRKSSPMKYKKYHRGSLDEYELYSRASGQALVMKREAYNEIRWSEKSIPGGIFCNTARRYGYSFIHKSTWTARHICKKASYNYRNVLVDGVWKSRRELATTLTGEQ